MKLTVQHKAVYAYTGGQPLAPQRPCVVFVHGALNDHSVWGLQSRYLANHGHSVLAVDLPGHGRSEGPALPSVEAIAQWLVDLLDAAGVERAALVGHSMGSLIGLEAAALLGERASHLAMVCTAFPMKVSQALLDTALTDANRAIDMVNAFSISTLAAKPSSPGPGFWLHGGGQALMRRLQAIYADAGHGNLFHHDFGVCDSYEGVARAATQLRCPVEVIIGSLDQMTAPKSARALAQQLGAAVVELPAGHSLLQEAPDALLNALKRFLAVPAPAVQASSKS
ncbi:MAG: alpha/beta hydrolase [Rhizobacter sp.]|nr:alpha/beta hydrolase [Rhizobacter sp.]